MIIRPAEETDLPIIIKLLSDDILGSRRENYMTPIPESYYQAYKDIRKDKNQELVVMNSSSGDIVGTLQLTFIPYLTYLGGRRSQIEAVRVSKDQRGKGYGRILFEWAIKRSREEGVHLVQLTTDKDRSGAIEFYRTLGFKDSHLGMKLHL
jgi:ribosomal protein S18 acetylase RimI-like enzyme|tara:strand:- start:2258 stop:2710 length:453 start_codon:yes stop_codon:yes gene_type:complete